MQNEKRTKAELTEKLEALRKQVKQLEKAEGESRRTEEALKESEDRYRSIIEGTGAIIFNVNRRGRFTYVNEAAIRALGYSPKEIIGRFYLKFVYQEDKRRTHTVFQKQLKEGAEATNVELRFVNKEGSVGWFGFLVNIIKKNGEIVGLRGVAQDITEQKRAEEALKESQRTLSTLMSNLPGMAYRCRNDRDWTSLFVSKGCFNLTGYDQDDFIENAKKSYGKIIHPEDREYVWGEVQKALEQKMPFTIEYRIITADNETKWVWEKGRGIFSAEGSLLYLEGFVSDITERKRAMESLRESEIRFRNMFNQTFQLAGVVILDGTLTAANKTALDFIGANEADVVGKPFWDTPWWSHSEELKAWLRDAVTRAAQGEGVRREVTHSSEDGDLHYFDFSLKPVVGEDGKALYLIPESRDITESKLAEEALRESEILYRDLVETSQDLIWQCDSEGKYIYLNIAWEDVFGFKVEEMLGKSFTEFQIPEYAERDMKEFARLLEGGTVKEFETVHIGKDGREINLAFSAKFVEDDDGNIIGTMGTAHDITERKRAEEALCLANDIIVRSPAIAFVWKNAEGWPVEFASENTENIFGWTSQDFMSGKVPYANVVHPDDIERVAEEVAQNSASQSTKSYTHAPYRIVRREGETRWVEDMTVIRRAKDGDVIAYEGIILDVTERKLAEVALRESEKRFRSIVEYSQAGILIVDESYKFEYVNDELTRILGYSREELVGQDFRSFLDEESKNLVADRYVRRQKGEEVPPRYEFNIVRKDGVKRRVEISSTVIKDSAGRLKTVAQIMDITERKRAEEALQIQKVYLEELFEHAPEAIVILDNEDRIQSINREFIKMFGYSSTEAIGEKINDLIVPAELKDEGMKATNDVAAGKAIQIETVRQSKNGKKIHVSILGNPIMLKGDQLAVYGIYRDITERKRVEEALREEAVRRRILIDQSRDGIVVLDRNGAVFEANQRYAEMLGYTVEEVRNLHMWDWDFQWTREHLLEMVNQVDETGDHFETKHRRKDGSIYDVEISTNGATIGGQKLVFCVCRDISDRKKAEEALKDSEGLFKKVINTSPNCIFVKDSAGKYVLVNEAIAGLYSVEPEDMVGKTDLELAGMQSLKKVEADSFTNTDRKTIRNGKTKFLAAEFLTTKDGSKKWFQTVKVPLAIKGEPDYVLGVATDITERVLAEEALRTSEEQYRLLIEQSNDAFYLLHEGKFEIINKSFSEKLGVTLEEAQAPEFNFLQLVATKSIPLIKERDKMAQRGEEPPHQYEFTGLSKDGREIEFEASVSYVPYRGGTAVQGILRDVTEKKHLEEQFRQAQKMEAVGRLAGGVAHDFNNLLTVIGGNVQLAMMSLDENDPLARDLRQIEKASYRASKLTGQLLAFSRRQQLLPKVLDLNFLVRDMEKMLRRVIGEDVDLKSFLADDLWRVKVDSGQFESIIVNLCVNARDAMPEGGTLTIETVNMELTDEYATTRPEVEPGSYVMLSVSDTGCGMTKEVKSQMFDPFYTTKAAGEGTGLGLSTVFGIVKQSGGFIYVYSEPYEGTTFKIYLPKTEEEAETVSQELLSEDMLYGDETVLVVEDEEGVRNIAVRTLEKYGYKVIEAENGGVGYLKCKKSEKPIDLIITDVIMPEMSGADFISSVKEFWPEIKVLYMSGYTYNVIAKKGVIVDKISFMQKPFQPLSILRKVREMLEK